MNKRKVVVIDDDRLILKLLLTTFSQNGWESKGAKNAVEGRKIISEFNPDLLVLDLYLPGEWSGLELLRILKQEGKLKDMKVVVITASDSGRYLNQCLEAGASMLIPKPFSPKAFLNQVEALFTSKEA